MDIPAQEKSFNKNNTNTQNTNHIQPSLLTSVKFYDNNTKPIPILQYQYQKHHQYQSHTTVKLF